MAQQYSESNIIEYNRSCFQSNRPALTVTLVKVSLPFRCLVIPCQLTIVVWSCRFDGFVVESGCMQTAVEFIAALIKF